MEEKHFNDDPNRDLDWYDSLAIYTMMVYFVDSRIKYIEVRKWKVLLTDKSIEER